MTTSWTTPYLPMTKTKHVPIRTCVGCRVSDAKREFVRVVREPNGTVAVDGTGTRDGRGAYLCARRECWEEALNKGRLARALRIEIPASSEAQLLAHAQRYQSATLTAATG